MRVFLVEKKIILILFVFNSFLTFFVFVLCATAACLIMMKEKEFISYYMKTAHG